MSTGPAPTTPPARRWRFWRTRLTSVGVGYAVVVGAVLWWGLAAMHAPEGGAPAPAPSCPVGAVPGTGAKPATLAPLGVPVSSIAFGRELVTQEREFEFTTTDPAGLLGGATCLPVHVNPFLRTGDGPSAEIDGSRIASVTSTSAPR